MGVCLSISTPIAVSAASEAAKHVLEENREFVNTHDAVTVLSSAGYKW
jgi:hypothetical protein